MQEIHLAGLNETGFVTSISNKQWAISNVPTQPGAPNNFLPIAYCQLPIDKYRV
jgi:hypothetical protein